MRMRGQAFLQATQWQLKVKDQKLYMKDTRFWKADIEMLYVKSKAKQQVCSVYAFQAFISAFRMKNSYYYRRYLNAFLCLGSACYLFFRETPSC